MRSASREAIMEALRAARPPACAAPGPGDRPPPPDDPVATLRASLRAAGGSLAVAASAAPDDVVSAVGELARAEHVHSGWRALPSRGVGLDAKSPSALATLEVCVLLGELAVAESGAVWNVPADPMERAAALLAEHLVLVVSARDVVGSLHDAYARIAADESPFGWFLSGPSKTADIEQALVLGAHGPRRMTLVLTPDRPDGGQQGV